MTVFTQTIEAGHPGATLDRVQMPEQILEVHRFIRVAAPIVNTEIDAFQQFIHFLNED